MRHVALLTRHGRVLLIVAESPTPTVEKIGSRLGLSTRTVRRCIADLQAAGLITRCRRGNRNHYEVHLEARTGDPALPGTLGDFLNRFTPPQ